MIKKILASVLMAGALAGCGGGSEGLFSSEIQYVVEGSATGASVTYATTSGGTSQEKVNLPWYSAKSSFADDEFVYISAQNQGNTGSITVKILSDGKVLKQTTSSGAYVIATASGKCC